MTTQTTTARRILVIASHPDDEILGVGGTIARHVDAGDDVHVAILGEGITSRASARDRKGADAALAALQQIAREAARTIGSRPPIFGGLPDNRFDSLDFLDIVKLIERFVTDVRPSIIYTHHCGDLNLDHVLTHRAVITAVRPLPASGINSIYCFETLSSTEWGLTDDGLFRPTHFVDITGGLARKLKALELYRGEMRQFPHPRSNEAVNALATLRGSQSGLRAAEAFEATRTIWR